MSEPEVWLRGPVPDIAPLLQPVAHCLLQCREEVERTLRTLTPLQIWTRPSGAAAPGFHVRHAAGSLDRLFTYARGEPLSSVQRKALAAERVPDPSADAGAHIAAAFAAAVDEALRQLRTTDARTLLEPRVVGRMNLPSTVLGLLFHAAEHTHRHVGQLVTTAKVITGRE